MKTIINTKEFDEQSNIEDMIHIFHKIIFTLILTSICLVGAVYAKYDQEQHIEVMRALASEYITPRTNETLLIGMEHFNLEKTVAFIADFEKYSATPYDDAAGESIGYGFASRGRTYMSKREADLIIIAEVKRLKAKVSTRTTRYFTPDQWTALLSFVYNVPTIWTNDEFWRSVDDDHEALATYWPLYQKSGGIVLRGLTKRRHAEIALFFKQI